MKNSIVVKIISLLVTAEAHAQGHGDIEAWAKNYKASDKTAPKAEIKPVAPPVPAVAQAPAPKPEEKPAPKVEKKKSKKSAKKEVKSEVKEEETAAPAAAAVKTEAVPAVKTEAAPVNEAPIVGFKDGISFEHKPTNFKTKFRFRIQSRFTYETEDDEVLKAEIADFTVRRVRLRLDGTVIDPRLLYRIQLSFTRGDMDYDRTQYPNILRDAAVGWKFTDSTTLWYGQTKLPGNRQRVTSSGSQQFVDRSILNSTFNIDRDTGIQLYQRIGEQRPFWVKLAVSNGEGRGTDNKDNGLAYTSRMEWLPLGAFKDDGDYFEADLARETTPKLSFGAVYSINKDTTRPGGQLGTQYVDTKLNRDIETSFVDALFKYQGFSLSGEYAHRWTEDAFFPDPNKDPKLTKNITIYKGNGFNAQAGYVMENNFEPSIRYSMLKADKTALEGKGTDDQKQYTVGLSKYINRHTVKIQGDLTFDEKFNKYKPESYNNSWITRLQVEIGI